MSQHNWRCDHPGCQKMEIDRSRRYSERIVCEEHEMVHDMPEDLLSRRQGFRPDVGGLVQRIVVAESGSRLDIVHCAAEASLRSYLIAPHLDAWVPWAKRAVVAVEWADREAYERAGEAGEPVEACWGQARALGFPPCWRETLPVPEGSFVPETYCRDDGDNGSISVTVAINEALRMPTDVAATAAARTVWGLWFTLPVRARLEWVKNNLSFCVSGVYGARYMTQDLLTPVGIAVDVVGFTELYEDFMQDGERLVAVGLKVSRAQRSTKPS